MHVAAAFTHAALIVAAIPWQALASAQTVSSSRDGYYMSTQRGFPSDGPDVWVFERDKMLAGQTGVRNCRSVDRVAAWRPDWPSTAPQGTPNYFVS